MSTKLNLKSLTKSKKIDSPLAKYNSAGQLFCVLCNSQVKNEIYWTGHVNGKAHKENLAQLKKSSGGSGVKRPAPPPQKSDEGVFKEPAPKRSNLGGASANSSVAVVEDNQKERKGKEEKIKNVKVKAAEEELLSMMVDEDEGGGTGSKDVGKSEKAEEEEEVVKSAPLPAGFFDDPKADAKARGIKFKDPQEAEWEKFVKEIATEDLKSSEIVGVDQEVSAVDRELEQIEEQMVHWQRVIQLEKKAEELGKLKQASSEERNGRRVEEEMHVDNNEEEDDEDIDYDEELEWRNKKR